MFIEGESRLAAIDNETEARNSFQVVNSTDGIHSGAPS